MSELQVVAKKKSWQIVDTIAEVVSGAAGKPRGWEIAAEREALEKVISLARQGKIDKVLVHEISRIARRNSDAHRFLEELTDNKVSLYWHTQGIETLLDNGKPNPAASIMFALLAEMARSERETLRIRVKSGLEEARRKGVVLGRPKGKVSDKDFLTFLELKKSIFFLKPVNLLLETIVFAPFLMASSINLFPSTLFPLIAKKYYLFCI